MLRCSSHHRPARNNIWQKQEGEIEMTEFSELVEDYIIKDRQWPRRHRIAYAKMMMEKGEQEHPVLGNIMSKNFWRAVLKRNED